MPLEYYFRGNLAQYWEVLYTEYQRLGAVLGQPPFEFMAPNPQTIKEYIPKNGDEIIFTFWDKEHRQELLVVEAALLPDEDQKEVQVMVFPQGNPFEEPLKSAMSIWKEIKNALKKGGGRHAIKTSKRKKKRKPQPGTLFALDHLREIYFKALKDKSTILPRKEAARKMGIVINTWREHDLELWNHWEDDGYRNQNMQ
jgi:hypothetical protein